MAKRFVTLEDVAQAANMSRAQVSRALRGDPGVRPEVREQIAKVAARLDYKPNLAARSLASPSSQAVGVVIGDVMNPFHIQLARAVDSELVKAGHDPMVSLRAIDDAATLREVERLSRLRAAGVILIATPHSVRAIGELASHLPCVYIGTKSMGSADVSTIGVDDKDGVQQAIGHLIALGHRRIAHIAGRDEASARERTQAYLQTMHDAGLEPLVVEGTHDAESGRRGVDVLMQRSPLPTAIFASSDFVAIGVLDRLKGRGVRVPEEMSVIGFDDIPSAANELLSLSTLRQDTAQQAQVAVKTLQAMMGDSGQRALHFSLPVQLILRRSVAAPPAEHN